MSSKYDDRIVRLGFDNAQFEAGASKSMSTLHKLSEKLKFKSAKQAAQDLQRSVDSVDFSSMARAIDKIESRFSAMGIAGMNVINKITDGIVGSVAKLEQATIGQIKTGGWARAMNIANAKFQIEGLGFEWEQIENAVSYGVKDTAYGLDAAASAASQLAASGIDFQKVIENTNDKSLTAMHKSLRAISGVAAMTNSSYEDIARIFTTVAGNGRLMGDQLLQLSSRGMNAAAKLAETLGTTEGEIRDMVSKGLIDFQTFAFAMDNAFGDHAKEANKTFTGALGNMKAALSRVGEIFADPIINKTNTLFIALTERIDEFKNKLKSIKVPKSLNEIKKQYGDISASAAAYDEILKASSERTVTFGQHFAEMWQSGIDAFSAMVKAVDMSWLDGVVDKVDAITVKFTGFFDAVKEYFGMATEESQEAADALTVTAEEAQAARDIILNGKYGNGATRKKALTDLFGEESAKNIQRYVDSVVAAGWSFEKAAIQIADGNEAIAESAEDVEKTKLFQIFDNIRDSFKNLATASGNIIKAVKKIGSAIWKAFKTVFKIDTKSVTDGMVSLTGWIASLTEKLIVSDDVAEKITGAFIKFFTVVKDGLGLLWDALKFVKDLGVSLSNSKIFKSITDSISNFFAKTKGDKKDGEDVGERVAAPFESLKTAISKIKDVPGMVSKFFKDFSKALKDLGISPIDTAKIISFGIKVYSISLLFLAVRRLGHIVDGIATIPAKVGTMVVKLGNMFKNVGRAAFIVSLAEAMKAFAIAIATIAAVVYMLGTMDPDRMYEGLAAVVVIGIVLKGLSKTATGLKGSFVSALRGIGAIGSVAILIAGIGVAIIAITSALDVLNTQLAKLDKDGDAAKTSTMFYSMVIILVSIGSILILCFALAKKSMNVGISLTPALLSLAVVMINIGFAFIEMAAAMTILTLIPPGRMGDIQAMFGLLAGVFVILLYVVSVAPARTMFGAAATILAFGFVLLELAVVASIMSSISDKRFVEMIDGMAAVIITMIGLAIAVMIAGTSFTKTRSSMASILAAFIGLSVLMLVVANVLERLSNIDNLTDSVNAMVGMMGAISKIIVTLGAVTAVLAIISTFLNGGQIGAKASISNLLMTVVVAFVAVAAAMLIFAAAMEKIIALGDGLTTAAIAFGIFMGAIVVLAALAAFFPKFGDAMKKIGDTFLAAGLGAALFGAGIYLVCAGVKILGPALPILAIGLERVFKVLEEHWLTAIIVTAAVVALTLAIVKFSTTLAPIATAIVTGITKFLGGIGDLLAKGTTGFAKWMSNLTTSGKAMVVALIVTLCAALLKASPAMLETIGKLIIKFFAYLGSIMGDITMGLVEMLIRLINGLTDAIFANSDRIIAALNGVLLAIVSLVLQLFGTIAADLVTFFGGDKYAQKIKETFSDASNYLYKYAASERKIAEEASSAKKEVMDSLKDVSDATEEASDKSLLSFSNMGSGMGGVTDLISQFAGSQKNDLASLKEEYNDLPGYAYDAILRSKQSQAAASSGLGGTSSDAFLSEFTSGFQNTDSGMPDMESFMSGNGWSTDDASALGIDLGSAETDAMQNEMLDTDGYYAAMSENQDDGTIKAIEDKKDDVTEAVRTNINEPAQEELRKGRSGFYSSGEYCVAGFVEAIDKDKSVELAVASLGDRLNSSFKNSLRIDSPSKEFYENAEYVILGFVNGINQNTENAAGAMSSLGDAVIGAFGNPIEYCAKIASGELAYNPRIRPVVDSSSLTGSARSIGAMFDNQTISLNGMSGRLAADIGTIDRSNLAVVAELRELRSDMAVMTDQIANMQMVMDTGVLVGQISGPIDKELGRRAIFKGRGN